MKAYKGFNKDMTCRGFQFEEGKTYEESEAILYEKGFHACMNPLDIFTFYPPTTSVYHRVDLDDVTDEKGPGTQICGAKNQDQRTVDPYGHNKERHIFIENKNCGKLRYKVKGLYSRIYVIAWCLHIHIRLR